MQTKKIEASNIYSLHLVIAPDKVVHGVLYACPSMVERVLSAWRGLYAVVHGKIHGFLPKKSDVGVTPMGTMLAANQDLHTNSCSWTEYGFRLDELDRKSVV